MNSNFKIFIHLGYPKTGSTYMQNYIFNNLTNVNFIGTGKNFDKDLYNIRKSIIHDNDKKFQKKINFLRKIIKKKIKKNSINIYSDEHFLIPTVKGYKRNIERIKKLFLEFEKNINIIIFTRKHSDLILSLYQETILIKKLLKVNSFNEILDKIEKGKLNNAQKTFLNHFNFLKTKKIIEKKLTKKIKIYDFDNFKKNRLLFIKKFLNYNKFNIKKIKFHHINKKLIVEKNIMNKHLINKLQNKKIIIFLSRILNQFLSTKLKYFIKDKIILFLLGQREYIKFEKIYLIDKYFKRVTY